MGVLWGVDLLMMHDFSDDHLHSNLQLSLLLLIDRENRSNDRQTDRHTDPIKRNYGSFFSSGIFLPFYRTVLVSIAY